MNGETEEAEGETDKPLGGGEAWAGDLEDVACELGYEELEGQDGEEDGNKHAVFKNFGKYLDFVVYHSSVNHVEDLKKDENSEYDCVMSTHSLCIHMLLIQRLPLIIIFMPRKDFSIQMHLFFPILRYQNRPIKQNPKHHQCLTNRRHNDKLGHFPRN